MILPVWPDEFLEKKMRQDAFETKQSICTADQNTAENVKLLLHRIRELEKELRGRRNFWEIVDE
jgi:hypothetical protein